MNRYGDQNKWIIWFSFCIAILLNTISWPFKFYFLQPSWLNLILIYWISSLPHRINIGTGFILGLIMDFIFGSIIGIQTLTLSVLSYLVVYKLNLLRNSAIWQQIIIITLMSNIVTMITFLVTFLINGTTLNPIIFYNSIINGIMWPWLFLFMQKINYKL